MDPATQGIMEMWQTAEAVEMILGRIGYLNLNLAITNALLASLIVVLRKRKDGEK